MGGLGVVSVGVYGGWGAFVPTVGWHPRPFQPPPPHPPERHSRLATSVCQARHNQAGPGPTEPCTGCSRFLLSSGCEWGKYYRVAHSTGPIPNEIPCRALVARRFCCRCSC